MKQHVVQMPTFGNNVIAGRINKMLENNSGWKLTAVHNIQVEKVGGPEHWLLVVFEAKDESVGGEFKE